MVNNQRGDPAACQITLVGAIVRFSRLLLFIARRNAAGAVTFATGKHYRPCRRACKGLGPIDEDWTAIYGNRQIDGRKTSQ
jgi:hypothetical protein